MIEQAGYSCTAYLSMGDLYVARKAASAAAPRHNSVGHSHWEHCESRVLGETDPHTDV